MLAKERVPCFVKRELRPCEPGYRAPVAPARGGDGKLLAALLGLTWTALPRRKGRP